MHKLKIDVAGKGHCLQKSIFGIKEMMTFFPPPRTCQVTKNMEQVARECENAKCSTFCNKILIETQFRMITSIFGMNYKANEQQRQQQQKQQQKNCLEIYFRSSCDLLSSLLCQRTCSALDVFPQLHQSRQHISMAIRKRHVVQFSM